MMDRPHRAWPIEHRCVCMCLQGALANNQIYIYACTSLHVCVCMRGHVSDYVQVCESVCVFDIRASAGSEGSQRNKSMEQLQQLPGQTSSTETSGLTITLSFQWERAVVLLLLTHAYLHTHRHTHALPGGPQSCLELSAAGEGGKRSFGDICRGCMGANQV